MQITRQRASGFGRLEHKDDGGDEGIAATKKAIDGLMRDFEAFKSKNDDRLKQIETKGSADPITDEEVKRINDGLDKIDDMAKKLADTEAKAAKIAELEASFDVVQTMLKRAGVGVEEKKTDHIGIWVKAAARAITVGDMNITSDDRKALADVTAEFKALNVGTDPDGGYLAPMEYVRDILKDVTEISPVRPLVTVRQTAGKGMVLPRRTGQFAARRINELGTKTETTGLQYGTIELMAPEMYAYVPLTNDMIEDAVFDMQMEIQAEAAEQFALKEGAEFVSGTGSTQMEGILTNSEVGEVNSGSATTIADADGTADGLIALKYALKTFYAPNARWLMSRATLKTVRTLKNATDDYIWVPGIAQGRVNTIDGDPYTEMPDMPSQGAGTYPVAYGDFRRAYTMLDRIAMQVQRDPFTGADTGQVIFRIRKRVGGAVVKAEAIKKLKCST